MADYKQDINELITCISEIYSVEAAGYTQCFGCITESTGEEYLDGRALAITEAIVSNDEIASAFRKLETSCAGISVSCDSCVVRKYCNAYINHKRKTCDASALQMVDLFCGAGGLSLGFTQEGFVTALANDIEACCVDTYSHNHPETPRDHIVQGDIRIVIDHLEELLKDKKIDVVVGGPPCQGFSMANRQRLIDDPRNHLYKSYVDIVKRVQPKFFVMENVKGMLSVAEQVKEDFNAIGYEVEYHILNAKDYGVPQNRERLIYIGNRVGVDNSIIFSEIFDCSKNVPNHVLRDALYALRELKASTQKNATDKGTKESGFIIEKNNAKTTNSYIDCINQGREIPLVFNHKARYNNDRDIEIYGRLNQGDKSDDPKIADIMPYASRNDIFKDKYFKLEEDKVCKTITAHMKFDCNMYIHPTQARGLTPREAARVQSYPDDYFFRGSYTKTYMQIGNSVPPLLGRAIAHALVKHIESEG